MMRHILRRLVPAVLWCALLASILSGFVAAAGVSGLYPVASMRYGGGITTQQAHTARRWATGEENETGLLPAFWAEQALWLQSSLADAAATGILTDGDPALLWQAPLRYGAWPGAYEYGHIVLSESLAWQLFGALDVVGQTVKAGGESYTVAGVLGTQQGIAILPQAEAPENGWQGVELSGQKPDDAYAAAEDFARGAGLAAADSIVCGGALAFVAGMLAWLPCAALLLAGGGLLLRHLLKAITTGRPQNPQGAKTARFLVVFCAGLVFAALLPTLLDALPGWLLPGQWGSFAHWGTLWHNAGARLQGLLALTPTLRDVLAKTLLLRLALCCFAATVLASVLLCRLYLRTHNTYLTAKQ